MARRSIAILGGGLLAQAVARLLARAAVDVRLWARRADARESLQATLPAATVHDVIPAAAADADAVLLAVPASGLREVAAQYGEVARGDQVVIHGVRGFCAASDGNGCLLPHQVIREESCVRKIGVLGGPLIAPDLHAGRALALVLGSRFDETFALIRELAAGTNVHVNPTYDLAGVEVAGAVSNVSALAAGMAEGLELGETARGVLLTRGLGEAQRLGVALGGAAATFSGLAGVGDLIPRRVTSTERHHQLGALLAAGRPLEAALAEVGGDIEGVPSAQRARIEAGHRKLRLPLIEAVDDVCRGARPAAEAIDDVLRRQIDLAGARADA